MSGAARSVTATPRTRAHVTGLDDLGGLHLRLGVGGLRLGTLPDGAPVAVRLFRPLPTQVAIAGPRYLARLLAFRALAIGANVEVISISAAWKPLLDLQPAGRVAMLPPGRRAAGATALRSDAGRPVLRCEEVKAAGFAPWAGLAPRQAYAVVCEDVGPQEASGLAQFDLALVQRPTDECLEPLQRTFALGDDLVEAVRHSGPGEVLVLAEGTAGIVSLSLTPLELSILGTPTS